MSPHTRRRIGVWLFAVIATGVFWAPMWASLEATGWGDWQWFHHHWEAGRVAILEWGELPLWNPYHCGGVSLWGNPQAQVYSPTWWATGLLFGTTVGHKLYVWLHAAIGFAGMFVLARREYGLSRVAALLAAVAWACSGFFAWHGAGGHATYLSFYWGPWILLAWRASARDFRYSAVVALLMFVLLVEGGHYPFPFYVLLLGFDLLARLVGPRIDRKRALAAAVWAGVLTAALGAMRIAPILITVIRHPKPVHDADALSIAELVEMMTAREHAWRWPGHQWVWGEYGTFLGWGLVVLGVAGTLFCMRRGRWHVVAGFVLFGAMTMGRFADWAPWSILNDLPIYSSLHVPSRFAVFLTFYMALAAGALLHEQREWLAQPRGLFSRARRLVPWLIVCALAFDLFKGNYDTVDRWNREPLDRFARSVRYYMLPAGRYREYATFPSRNVGTPACYDPVPWDISRGLWTGAVQQSRVEPRDAGRVLDEGRRSRSAWVTVELDRDARVVLNQNAAPGWTASEGKLVEDRGRIALDLPAGEHTVRLRYEPDDLPWSLAGTALGALLALLTWGSGRGWLRRTRAALRGARAARARRR